MGICVFTQKQVEDLVDALLTNRQIHMIIADDDVKEFYQAIYDNYSSLLTRRQVDSFEELSDNRISLIWFLTLPIS